MHLIYSKRNETVTVSEDCSIDFKVCQNQTKVSKFSRHNTEKGIIRISNRSIMTSPFTRLFFKETGQEIKQKLNARIIGF